MKKLKLLAKIFKQTGASKVIIGFLIMIAVSSLILVLAEPEIKTYGDALWYCYAVVTTVGFGDIVVSGVVAKIISVILSISAIFTIAIITGVAMNFFNQLIKLQEKGSLSTIVDKLENLENLSKEELGELSRAVKKYRN